MQLLAHDIERKLIAPVPSPPKTGKFPKTAFQIGPEQDQVTCPVGCTTRKHNRVKLAPNRKGKRYRVKRSILPQGRCAICPLRDRCAKGSGPRSITLHPDEARTQEARRYQGTEGFRQDKRRRQEVEHAIARLKQRGARQARYRGRVKTRFQLLMAATVVNLTLVTRRMRPVTDALSAAEGIICSIIHRVGAYLGIDGHRACHGRPTSSRGRNLLRPVISSQACFLSGVDSRSGSPRMALCFESKATWV